MVTNEQLKRIVEENRRRRSFRYTVEQGRQRQQKEKLFFLTVRLSPFYFY
jgi:hypothetical protein